MLKLHSITWKAKRVGVVAFDIMIILGFRQKY
jgi:hypothetical protein